MELTRSMKFLIGEVATRDGAFPERESNDASQNGGWEKKIVLVLQPT